MKFYFPPKFQLYRWIGSLFLLVFTGALARASDVYGNRIPIQMWTSSEIGGTPSSVGGVSFLVQVPIEKPGDTGYIRWSAPFPRPTPPQWTAKHNFGVFKVVPFRTYAVDVDAQYLLGGYLSITAPDGYKVSMVDPTTGFDGGNTFTFSNPNQEYTSHYRVEVMIVPDAAKAAFSAPVGECSSLTPGKLEWHVSLGTTYDGETAGELVIMDSGESDQWDLYPKPNARGAEMTVNGTNESGGWYSPQAAFVLRSPSYPNPDGKYDLAFYANEQKVVSGTGVVTFTGEPFVKYHWEQGSTPTSLVITKETRNITSATSTGNPAKKFKTSITRSGTAPAFRWEVSDWKEDGASATIQHNIQGAAIQGGRTLSAESKYEGSAAAVVSKETFTQFSWGEALTKKEVGSSGGPSMTYEYYQDANDVGQCGRVKTQTSADGSWECYAYWGAGPDPQFEAGALKETFRPWNNSPATPSTDPSHGEYNLFWYAQDAGGAYTRPTLIQKSIEGQIVSKTAITYASDGTIGPFAMPVIKATRTEYSSSGSSLVTVTRFFSEADLNPFFRKRIHSVQNPDGTKVCYAYQYGTWDGTTFSVASNAGFGGLQPPKGSRISAIKGTATSGDLYSTFGNYDIEDIRLVSGKSTLESTIRDAKAHLVRTESYVWSAGAWELVGFKNYEYNYAGQLIKETDNDGSTIGYTYDGLRLVSQTDNTGVTTNYAYDAFGRISTKTQAAVGSIAELKTAVEYDAAGQVTKETRGYGGTETMVSGKGFDDSGRLTSETAPGVSATTHTYNLASRIHTATRPDGGTVIETANLDGSLASVTGTGTVATYYSKSIDSQGYLVTTERSGSTTSPRWKETTKDWLGRITKTKQSAYGGGTVTEDNFYLASSETNAGRLYKAQRTASPTQRFEYDAMGDLVRSGSDYDDNGLTVSSSDRITDRASYMEKQSSAWWKVDETWVYPTKNSATRLKLSSSRIRLTGFSANQIAETRSVDSEGNTTVQTTSIDPAAHTATRTATRSGFANEESETFIGGLSVSKTSHDGITTSFTYDALHRLSKSKDGRGNVTTIKYQSGTSLQSSILDGLDQTVSSQGYDTSGRLAWSSDALNNTTYISYTTRGEVWRQWGAGAHPVEYLYDSIYGDRTGMKTYRSGTSWANATWPGGTADTTTWGFDASTGLVISKTDAAAKATTFAYNLRGQPTTVTQTKASGTVVKTYSYFEGTGELKAISYSDGTPGVSYYSGTADTLSSYTRLGQVTAIVDDTGTRLLAYNDAKPWRLDSETLSAQWSNRVLTQQYASSAVIGRNTGFSLGTSSSPSADLSLGYGYSSSGLNESVTSTNASGTTAFSYAYLANSRLISNLSIGTEFRWDRGYEPKRDILTRIEFQRGSTPQTGFTYESNARGQRTSVKQYGPVFSDYGSSTFQRFAYTSRGALDASTAYAGEDASVPSAAKALPGRNYQYAYDPIGNRQSANNTGVADLANDYTPTATNTYQSRENNSLSISGTALASAKVAVSSSTKLAARQGTFWYDEITVDNQSGPWQGNLSVFAAASDGSSARKESRHSDIPGAAQPYSYDERGNLTADQIWDYTWDAESRLTQMSTSVTARNAGYTNLLLNFRYDYLGRRVEKLVRNGATQAVISQRRFIYHGWDLVAEYSVTSNALGTLVRSYAWGLDPNGALTLTGGAGALLQITDHPSGKRLLPAYDGNGNIVALFNRSGGSVAAVYEYTPFGEPLREEVFDSTVADQPYRFATKFLDQESRLLNYGRRFYSPSLGRFISRDPIEEKGGINLYNYCGGDPVNQIDILGEGTDDSSSDETVKLSEFNVTSTYLRGTSRFTSVPTLGSVFGRMGIQNGGLFDIGSQSPFPAEFKLTYASNLHFGVQKLSSGPDPRSPGLADINRLRSAIQAQIRERHLKAGDPVAVSIIINGKLMNAVTTVAPNSAANNAGPEPVVIQSHWLLRALVPGQIAWDNARTAAANGNYGNAVMGTAAMLGEIAVSISPAKFFQAGKAVLGKTLAAAESELAFIRCFPPGTLVLMADGSTNPIEQIKEGDEVLADDPTDPEKPTTFKVAARLENFTEHLVTIEAEDSAKHVAHFQATREHPFWVKGKGWTNAKDLTGSDVLADKDGGDVCVLRVVVEDEKSPTFNLTIDSKHTFYVVDNGVTVLVHNASPFEVGTMNSLNGGIHVGDGLFAHEVLPNAYLRSIGYGNPAQWTLFGENPAIALSQEFHGPISAMQTQWGIRNPSFLKGLNPQEVIHMNYEMMLEAGVPESQALKVSQSSLKYVEQLRIACP